MPALSSPAARRRRGLKPWHYMPYVFVAPFFVLFVSFGLFPLLFSAYASFFRWELSAGVAGMKWEGLGNYAFVLQLDALPWPQFFSGAFWAELHGLDFWRALYNTFWLGVVSGLPQHLIAIPLAYFIHMKFRRARNPAIAMYFLPYITNTVAITLVFSSLFSRDFGVVNQVLTGLAHAEVGGVKLLAWLFPAENIDWGRPEYTRPIVAFIIWWRFVGWNTVLYLSALQTIPKDLYEAATIDGAGLWQQFRYITLPMLRPMILFAVTLTIIGNLQLFEEPFILTGGSGGVGQVAETVAMQMYKVGLTDGDFGTASAVAWLMFMVIAALTWLNNRYLGKKD
ncbi:carbohydrate ABC transporter permease [Rhizobacter sp. Root1221]|uniref:carbohydrate ABC transporter permease n=1 Tax=Rhizobacter sp. Root1221 TaxID=1736433 RepID=UPI000AA1D4F3|nr:sugar ABC transporter permease [Rhizobacter sp. Root1221]